LREQKRRGQTEEKELKVDEEIKSILAQQHNSRRNSSELRFVKKNIEILDIKDKEIINFFINYDLSGITGNTLFELLDIYSPNNEVVNVTKWARDTYGISDNYICLTSGEDEGFILLSKENGHIYDVDAGEIDALNSGKIKHRWNSFLELIKYYVSKST